MSERLSTILNGLNHKAALKQEVYDITVKCFSELRSCVADIQDELAPKILPENASVEVIMSDYGDFEFHLKFSGDTIVFIMHTNVFTFPPTHPSRRTDYIRSNPNLGYFGMIQIYNFLSDSIKYNRLSDEGYQLARIFINQEGNFFVEGKRKLGFIFNDVSKNKLTRKHMQTIIEQCMIFCLDFDLYVPPVGSYERITVQQKNYFNNPSGIATGKRLGFQVVDHSKHKR
ncbi:MAG: hypothetical protein H6608_09425 [Flavobacteriales bacterium]|nr:hypothetical protein [Bacteroidota bacterium]MCB9241341.1 hypothetical protein [Flavobacteriales bacterium]